MKIFFFAPLITSIHIFFSTFVSANEQSSEFSGTNSIYLESASQSSPKYYISSVSASGDAVFSGTVENRWDGNSSVSFTVDTNSSGDTVWPIFASGVFKTDMQIPAIGFTDISGAIASNGMSATYHGGFGSAAQPSGAFTGGAPEIIIEAPDTGADGAEANATVNGSGKITGFDVYSGGSDYGSDTSAGPKVTIVGGPHFLKITDEDSNYSGRVFLITNNEKNSVILEMSRLADSEPTTVSTYFPVGTQCEIIPAPTLGSTFGMSLTDLPTNWTTGLPEVTDWIYLWNVDTWSYQPYFFLDASYEGSGFGQGWYSQTNPGQGLKNNMVLYPDEAFIIAKRSANTVTFELDGMVNTSDQKLYLPESGNQALAKNPYGTDLLLGELIPSTSIGTGTGQFNPGSSDSDADSDQVHILTTGASGMVWTKYWYLSSVDTAVTEMRSLDARQTSTSMSATDFYIGKGQVTGLQSCTDTAGSSTLANGTSNDGNYTKISLNTTNGYSPSGRTVPEIGFTITLSDIQGRLLYDGGAYEANASTGESVANSGDDQGGSVVYSDLIGTHEVVGSGTGFVVIEKQRDVNFKSDEGTPIWTVGSEGSGYTHASNFYCVGGNNGTTDSNATGTVNVSGSSVTITVTSGGSGYTSAPSAVITTGGWREGVDNTTKYGNETIKSSDGVLIRRRHPSGVKAFIDSSNPF